MPESATAAPPAAPAAPSPTPAAPAAPAKNTGAPKVTLAQPVSKPAENLEDAYAQLGKIVEGSDETPPAAPEPKTGDEPGDEPADESTETPPAEPPKEPAKPAKPEKAADLRKHYEASKTRVTELEAKVKELEGKLSTPNTDLEKLNTQLAEREKKIAAYEEELRYTNFERSQEYQDKYWKPFEQAYNDGRARVAELTIKNDAGEEVRKATPEDFDRIMQIADNNAAAEAIEEMFGTGVKAQVVLTARLDAMRANAKRLQAMEDYKKNGSEREKARTEEMAKHRSTFDKTMRDESAAAIEKYPKFFKPVEGETETNQLLEKGFEFADSAIWGQVKDAEGKTKQLPPMEIAKRQAVMRNKAAAFDSVVHKWNKAQKELRELKKRLAEFEDSDPAGGGKGSKGGRPTPPPAGNSMEGAIAELTRRAR